MTQAWELQDGPGTAGTPLRVLYIDDRTPHQHLGAGLPRANTLLNLMAEFGYAVTFCSVHGEAETPEARYRDLSSRITVIEPCGETGLRRLFLDRPDAFDVLWVSRPPHIDLVTRILGDLGRDPRSLGRTRVVFDCESLFALRDFVGQSLDGHPATAAMLSRASAREIRNFALADRVVCVSPSDARLLTRYGRLDPVVLGHTMVPRLDAPGHAARSGFLFIGSLAREKQPNIDSLDWFFAEVWPAVRASLPEARMTIVGVTAPSIRARLSRPGVTVHGWVADTRPLFDAARVSVAPTRFAAGIPHKVHKTASQGLPGIVTPILAEQIGWPNGTGYLVRDWRDPQGFAEGLVRLHEEAETWSAVQRNGFTRIRDEWDPVCYRAILRDLCEGTRPA